MNLNEKMWAFFPRPKPNVAAQEKREIPFSKETAVCLAAAFTSKNSPAK